MQIRAQQTTPKQYKYAFKHHQNLGCCGSHWCLAVTHDKHPFCTNVQYGTASFVVPITPTQMMFSCSLRIKKRQGNWFEPITPTLVGSMATATAAPALLWQSNSFNR